MPHQAAGPLADSRGRVARKLRISVTDRCNFACLFCMPEKDKMRWLPEDQLLGFEEVLRVTKVIASMGVTRVRVTGGEPLLRKGVERLVGMLASVDELESIDMTSNGWFLAAKARALKAAGLDGVTVSLHSLDRAKFSQISGADALPRVLAGIEAAISAGLDPVKINSVAIRGYNDGEIGSLVEFAHSRGLPIRFIEFMPLDGLGIWSPDRVMSGAEILRAASNGRPLQSKGRNPGSTSSQFTFDGGSSDLGLITPMTDPFCDDCDRVRLTADGKLLSCLFDTNYYDLKPMLRDGATDGDLSEFIRRSFAKKPAGVAYMPWVRESWPKPRNMNAIGG